MAAARADQSRSPFGALRRGGYPGTDVTAPLFMIGLSVAVGRFVEALFWAIFRVAGVVAGAVVLAVLVAVVGWIVVRRLMRRR